MLVTYSAVLVHVRNTRLSSVGSVSPCMRMGTGARLAGEGGAARRAGAVYQDHPENGKRARREFLEAPKRLPEILQLDVERQRETEQQRSDQEQKVPAGDMRLHCVRNVCMGCGAFAPYLMSLNTI